jgi:bisphosphoglycerate-dependent phosphoglycerate mutase
MAQLHKRFNNQDVKELLKRYLNKEIKRKYVCEILGIGKTRFFALLKMYKESPAKFSIQYRRTFTNNQLSQSTENLILKELKKQKALIVNREVPLSKYNYSFIKENLKIKYKQAVSLPTIINRAKKYNFYIPKRKSKKEHSKEVLTNYVGELIQHDTSYHLFSPPS